MEYNVAAEICKFNRRWDKLQEEYEKAGMSKEAIKEMKEYDYKEMNAQRVYCKHNQFIDDSIMDSDQEEKGENPLLNRNIEKFSYEIPDRNQANRYGWLEEIEDKELYVELMKLCLDELDILTQLVYENFSMTEIAEKKGISPQAVSQRINKIRKKIKKFSKLV